MIKFALSLDIQRYLDFEVVKFIETYGKSTFGIPSTEHDHNHDHED